MLQPASIDPRDSAPDRVSDRELALAAVMVGIVVLVASLVVPLVG
jgi:hypothetical protein